MQDFRCVTDTISAIKIQLDEVQSIIESALIEARSIKSELEKDSVWTGQAQLVGLAFLDIVVQYHNQLTFGNEESGGTGAVEQASVAFENYLKNNADFYDGWDQFNQVTKI